MDTINVLAPDYYSEFHCVGSECPEHCCGNWGEISIDKETYKKYKNFVNPDFNKKIQTALKPLKKPDGSIEEQRAAVVVLNERGVCPFLTENKLCEIQQKMGATYLSRTCKTYPRNRIRNIKSSLETSLTLSCPEVARLALSSGSKQKFVKTGIDKKFVDANKSNVFYGGALKDYVFEFRQNCIEMMQDDRLPILQRIFSIAHFLQGMENTLYKREDSENKVDLRMSTEQVTGAIHQKVRCFPDYMLILKLVIEEKFGSEGASKISDTDIHKYVITESQEWWKNLIKDKSLMFENYFVNFIFQKVFPFTHSELNMFQHAYLLWERYELCRFFLGMFSIKASKIDEADIAKVVGRIERHFSHEKPETTVNRILKIYKA